jgi:hypothetical protein
VSCGEQHGKGSDLEVSGIIFLVLSSSLNITDTNETYIVWIGHFLHLVFVAFGVFLLLSVQGLWTEG